MTEQLYTTKEIAQRLRLSDQTIRRWITQGKLRAIKAGRNLRIPESEVKRLLEDQPVGGK